MRPIENIESKLDSLLTAEWKQAAQNARTSIAAKAEDERSEAINSKADVWRGAKNTLRQLSNNKCWYCETPIIREDGAVDHHRPKNQVKDFPSGTIVKVTDASGQQKDHPGYWWLAFEPSNFRFCCQFCNEIRRDDETDTSGGKSSFFPVFDESKRISEPCELEDLEDETAILLDPVITSDALLLSFDRSGKAIPIDPHNRWGRRRAEASIRVYHLYHDRLEKARAGIDRAVARKVKQAQRHYQNLDDDESDTSAHDTFKAAVQEIRDLIGEDAPYSRQARATLRVFRGYPWVDSLL